MVVGGNEGSTRGLRFNPRESAEELQDDSSVGREDSEERALHDAKKREEQDKRARKLQGIQHMKIKIPQKNPEDEEDSQMKQQAELAQMTGQVGQNEANAGANPKGGGGGLNMLLSTAPFIDEAFDMIKKKDKKGAPKYDDEKPKKTTTVETQLSRERAKKGKRKKKYGMKDTESAKRSRARKRRLKGGNVRQPGIASTMSAARAPYVSFGLMGTRRPSVTGPRILTTSTGRTQARIAANPQKKVSQDFRQAMRQDTPTQDVTPPIPTVTTESRKYRAPRGARDSKPHKKAERQPRTAITPGGKDLTEHLSLAGGGASAMASGGIGSDDAILASEEFLKARTQKLKLGISPRDRIEYRQLIDSLNHLLRRLMRKADASSDDPPTNSSPNADRRMTSAPTGATEADPEDDPTMWGAHPYDLYVRRGGIA